MLSTDAFYARIYPTVKAELGDFSHAVRRLRTDPEDHAAKSEIVTISSRLLLQAFLVCEAIPPRSDVGGVEHFVHDLDTFCSASDRLGGAASECAHSLKRHLDYFNAFAGEGAEAKWSVGHLAARDLAINVANVLTGLLFGRYKWRSRDPRRETTFFDTAEAERAASEQSKALIRSLDDDLSGWCSYDKAMMLYTLAREFKPVRAVEIGIYGGQSLVPVALALKDNRLGSIVGIETWSAAAASKYATSLKNDLWWATVDYDAVKRSFFRYLVEKDLLDAVKIVEASSDQAAPLFDSIDFIHIDGGHSAFGAAQDIVNFVPRVRSGGIVVFDDIDWETTGPGLELLLDTCKLLHVVSNKVETTMPGCAAFMKL